MNNNILNSDYTKSSQQSTEKEINNKTINQLESQIIKKLTSLEQVIDTSIKKHGDKALSLA